MSQVVVYLPTKQRISPTGRNWGRGSLAAYERSSECLPNRRMACCIDLLTMSMM